MLIGKTLEKSLKLVFKELYPQIQNIKVSVDESMGVTYYKVFVGIIYKDLLETDVDKLKDEIKDFSKMFINKDSIQVILYDPNSPN
jgi:hypothetical protein